MDGCGGEVTEFVGETMYCGLSSSVSVDVQSEVMILVYQVGTKQRLIRAAAQRAANPNAR